MKSIRLLAAQLLALAIFAFTLNSLADETNSPREKLLLDFGWKFHLGDDWPDALHLNKAGISTGPAAIKFDDASWRTLNLPHDWAIELPFDKTADANHGFKPVGPGFPQNNIGWYRRTFDLPATDSGKRIWLTFDGAFRDTTVWVNGWEMLRNESGYYPFRADITDVVKFGGTNLITVKVDASKFEGWFYEGAGIYRHVWLDKTSPVAIAPDGVFVWSEFKGGVPEQGVEVHIKTTIQTTNAGNLGLAHNAIALRQQVFDPNGKQISEVLKSTEIFDPRVTSVGETEIKYQERKGEFDSSIFILAGGGGGDGSWGVDQMVFQTAMLWTPESPNLYKLVSTVEVDGKVVDQKETAFGIRTFAFDKDKGFLLNGIPYELKGTCNHQDMAGVGAALPDALQYFRIAKLKEFGDNAYRTSHNPPTPELLDACDHLGMIVMDENRLLGSDPANMARFEDFIRRDRNHASVGIWSICNEENLQTQPVAGRVGLTMQNKLLELDTTRPITAAENVGNIFTGLPGTLQVRGWNYNVGTNMDKYHAAHPDQPEVGTEQASTTTTRGIYADDKERGYVRAYDERGINNSEKWWSYFAARPWLSGGFVWTGFDYRGEPSPYKWPCINSHFGILDTCGFPKDNFYYYQSWWTTNVVLHLLPHWNWPGKEGQEIRVDALSNCKSVELFLNGESLGKQTMKPNSKLSWQVKYAPGTLSAKGFDESGNQIAETKVETTGDPATVQLTPNRTTINADGEDVSVVTVAIKDSQNRFVPTAQNKINFSIEGAGKILGVGNGDPSCHEPDTFIANSAWSRSVFNGLAQVLVQSTKDAGEIKLTASADGLQSVTTTIQSQPCELRPSVPQISLNDF
jgi:beta-galactosidase